MSKPTRVEVETEAEPPKVSATNHSPTPSPAAVIAPQVMLPEASVVSALLVLQAPKRPRVVVPTLSMLKRVVVAVAVEDAIRKRLRVLPVAPAGVATVSCARGEVVPMPTLPLVARKIEEVAMSVSVPL